MLYISQWGFLVGEGDNGGGRESNKKGERKRIKDEGVGGGRKENCYPDLVKSSFLITDR